MAEIAEVLVAFRRLQNFLELDEKTTETITSQNKTDQHITSSDASVLIKNGNARWQMPTIANPLQKGTSKHHKDDDNFHLDSLQVALTAPHTLSNINVEFPEGKLIGIIGSVGAGKSSFLQLLLRELPLETGSISINGTISYASQESWIFAGTVRQNILFGQEYKRERYNAVVKTCALVKDFDQFENGDQTIIGERGASLSGGQRARLK